MKWRHCGQFAVILSARDLRESVHVPVVRRFFSTACLQFSLPSKYVLLLQGVMDRDLLPDTTKTIKFEGRLLRLYLRKLT